MAKRATREAFGETLVELVESGLDVVAVDADLAGSTKTEVLGKYDPDRLVDVGIAEQNMIDVAAGLSMTGRIAFTGSFAVFGTGRCYDQIRNTVCESILNVKICPTHSGITVGPDGGTHQMLEDISLMRVLPNMKVLVPADFNSAKAALKIAAETPGPVYVRLGRAPVPEVYDEDEAFKLPYANVVRKGIDITLCACGVMVDEALKAAELLAARDISAEVVDVFSIKPLDKETIVASAAKTGKVVTCEEHSVYGGMGSAVAELLAQRNPVPMRFVGMKTFGSSGEPDELMRHYDLDAQAIVRATEELLY